VAVEAIATNIAPTNFNMSFSSCSNRKCRSCGDLPG
jgi:hypothetical protein